MLEKKIRYRAALFLAPLGAASLLIAAFAAKSGPHSPAAPAKATIEDPGRIATLDDLYAGNPAGPGRPSDDAATIEDGAKIATLNDLYPATKAALPSVAHARARPHPIPAPARKVPEQPVATAPPRPPMVTVPLGQAVIARDSHAPVMTLPPPDSGQ